MEIKECNFYNPKMYIFKMKKKKATFLAKDITNFHKACNLEQVTQPSHISVSLSVKR